MGFFFPIHMITAAAWEEITGSYVAKSTPWYYSVATVTTLSLSVGPTAWAAARAWDDWRSVAVFVMAALAAHGAVALAVGVRGGFDGGAA